MMILPQIGRGQIGLSAETGQMQGTPGMSPMGLQGAMMSGQPGSQAPQSIVPELPMNVQHPVAQLPQNMGAGKAAAGNSGLDQSLAGMKQLLGGVQKGVQGLQKAQGGIGASQGAQAALAPQTAPQSPAMAAQTPAGALTPPAAPEIPPAGLLGSSQPMASADPTALGGLFGLLGGGLF